MSEAGFDFMSLAPLILIFVVFYFLLIRPQQKQMKERKNMLASLSRGDNVITNGGVIGKITKIDDKELLLEVSKGVEIRVVRSMVNSIISKTDTSPPKKKEEKKSKSPKKTTKSVKPQEPAKKAAAPKKKPAKKPAKKK